MPRKPDLLGVAERFVTRRPVDWAEEESSCASDSARDIVRNLRMLARIAAVHDVPFESDHQTGHDPAAPEVRRWGTLRIMERVGAGSYGDVFRAWDESLDREVALKLLPAPAPVAGRDSRIVEEGRLLARIRHPNVAAVYGAERRDGTIGIWMEFIHGRTLAQIVSSDGTFSAEEAALIGSDVCRAVAAVHAAGLVHGDVKAQNIIRETGGRLVLSDFGSGVDLARAQDGRVLRGTPAYIAPEIFEGVGPFSCLRCVRNWRTALFPGVRTVPRGWHKPERCQAALDPDRASRFRSPGEMISVLERRHRIVIPARARWVGLTGILVLAVSGWLVVGTQNGGRPAQTATRSPSAETNAAAASEGTIARARQSLAQRTPAGFREALLLFEQVVSANPVHARAYSGIADTYSLLGAFGVLGRTEAISAARDAAQKSVRLGPDFPDGHASMSFVAWQQGNRAAAFRHVEAALEKDPGYAVAHHWHALYLMDSGRYQDAIEAARRARALDPDSPIIASDLALILRGGGMRDEAIVLLHELVQTHPKFAEANMLLADIYREQGRYDLATNNSSAPFRTVIREASLMRGWDGFMPSMGTGAVQPSQ